MPTTMQIPLTQGKVALVDEGDYPQLSLFRWYYVRPSSKYCAGHEGYAHRHEHAPNGGRKSVTMHHEIMKPPPGMEVDHIRIGSGLDNRRCNLRVVDRSSNRRNCFIRRHNTSGYRGVSLHKDTGKWQASIRVNGKHQYLGIFSTPEEASAAYEAARERLGLLKAQSD